MKRFVYLASMMLATVAFVACNNQPEQRSSSSEAIKAIDKSYAESFYGYAEISVPAGVTTVYLENYSGVDAQGHKQNLKITPMQVNPVVATPTDGKDVEPFGTVKLLFQAPAQTMVAVYYVAGDGAHTYVPAPEKRRVARAPMNVLTEEEDDSVTSEVYSLSDFPIDKITFGEFGVTRYVIMPWDFAWYNSESTNWQNTKSFPKDVVFYDAAHNHTLRYKFAYEGGNQAAYFLDDAYEINDYVVTGEKYNYCGGCGNCPYCMPWGCSCGCNSTNPDFVGNGDLTGGSQSQVPVTTPEDVVVVNLPEPAPYVTSDQEQTFYHSSGVVMFEDSWPSTDRNGAYDTDFDDVIIDYDIETKTVADELLESEGWREEVKVVMHVRAVGSNKPERVGVILEGFDQSNVDYIDVYKTLDSWQNAHGELPSWTVNTLQANSLHYEVDPTRPLAEIGAIFRYRDAGSGAGTETYIYTNNDVSAEHVFNPALKQYEAWGGAHESQYSPELASLYTYPLSLASVQGQTYYNSIPGYINVAGGLYTYTIIYHMKARADMDPIERDAVKQNMIETVTNTTNQNFYIIAKNGRIEINGTMRDNYVPVHLKGYRPADFAVKGFGSGYTYKDILDANVAADVAKGADAVLGSDPYVSKEGYVWAFKCPTLTKHVWNKQYFSDAYPHYEEWVLSNGTNHSDWYEEDVDGRRLVCWW